MLMKARIERRTLPDTGRIIAISDVHGNLEYLRGLLNKLDLRGEDTLVFCGDIMEKGSQSLDTLHFLMDLNERRRCWFVLGNCDYWYDERDHSKPCRDWYVRDYLLTNANGNGPGLLQQMCDAAGVTVDENFDIDAYYKALGDMFPREFEFLASMPQVIETEHYIFVHGGLPEGDPATWDGWYCMKNDDFMEQGRKFDKWVIVGHWPGHHLRQPHHRPREPHHKHRRRLRTQGRRPAQRADNPAQRQRGLHLHRLRPLPRAPRQKRAGGQRAEHLRPLGRQRGGDTLARGGVFPHPPRAHGL